MQQKNSRDYSGLHFLIAEDNELYAEIMMELLTIRHAEVCRAQSGEDAIRLLCDGGRCFDAVLMDVQMPGMNGYETTRAIRALSRPERAQVPVVAMTASSDECEQRCAMEAGMNAFLQKPLEMARLDEVLGQVLTKWAV